MEQGNLVGAIVIAAVVAAAALFFLFDARLLKSMLLMLFRSSISVFEKDVVNGNG